MQSQVQLPMAHLWTATSPGWTLRVERAQEGGSQSTGLVPSCYEEEGWGDQPLHRSAEPSWPRLLEAEC